MSLERKSTVVHRGKAIAVHDYTGISQDEFVPTIRALTADVLKGSGSEPLLLLDITGCTVSRDVVFAFKQSAAQVRPVVRQIAIVGVEGVQMFLLQAVNRFASTNVEPFRTRSEALDFLAR